MKSSALFLLSALLFIGCEEKKPEPVAVGEMAEYRDPGYGFKISYPKEWRQLGNTGKAVFAKSHEVVEKFQSGTSGEEGAMVAAEVMLYQGKKADELIAAANRRISFSPTPISRWRSTAPFMRYSTIRANAARRGAGSSSPALCTMNLSDAWSTRWRK